MQLTYIPSKNPLGKSQSVFFDAIQVNQGINEVSEEIKQHPDFNLYLESGAFIVNENPVQTEIEAKATKTKKEPALIELTEK